MPGGLRDNNVEDNQGDAAGYKRKVRRARWQPVGNRVCAPELRMLPEGMGRIRGTRQSTAPITVHIDPVVKKIILNLWVVGCPQELIIRRILKIGAVRLTLLSNPTKQQG
jgi:hypothetical protein